MQDPQKQIFYRDICKALVSANIPLAKINNATFRQFLQQYTGQNIPDQFTLRKGYLQGCYEDTRRKIRDLRRYLFQ